jgi:hypothetical protein
MATGKFLTKGAANAAPTQVPINHCAAIFQFSEPMSMITLLILLANCIAPCKGMMAAVGTIPGMMAINIMPPPIPTMAVSRAPKKDMSIRTVKVIAGISLLTGSSH